MKLVLNKYLKSLNTFNINFLIEIICDFMWRYYCKASEINPKENEYGVNKLQYRRTQ
jgi:hypothetical protein